VPATPVVKSFLIADSVIQDRLTGKWSVIGLFNRVMAPQFPVMHPTVAIYVKIADAQGRYRVKVEFRDSEDRVVSAFEGLELEVKDRSEEVEFGLPTHLLPLGKPGRYFFQLHLNGELLASARLDVQKIESSPPPAPP
jgi:hypothetical protein